MEAMFYFTALKRNLKRMGRLADDDDDSGTESLTAAPATTDVQIIF